MVEMDAEKRPASITVVKQELRLIADEWSTQQMSGVQARGPYLTHQPPTAFWQIFLPPSEETVVPLAAGRTAQMSLLQLPAPGIGGSSTFTSTSAFGSIPIPQKTRNGMAIASLVFSILGIVAPLFFCASSVYLIGHFPSDLSFTSILVLAILVMPSMMAVVFGHIGKHRANTVHGLGESKDMAVMGLFLGYLFGSIYLALALTILFGFF